MLDDISLFLVRNVFQFYTHARILCAGEKIKYLDLDFRAVEVQFLHGRYFRDVGRA